MVANLYREHCKRERHKLYKNGPATPASWLHINKIALGVGVAEISETMQKQSISSESQGNAQGKQQRRCKECDVLVDDKLYREHCKSGWHKHNYTRHKNGLLPLSQEECMVEMELADSKKDLKDYDF